MNFEARVEGITLNGKRIDIKGANLFGCETETQCVHGLWAVSLNTIVDFFVKHRFNLVRLPMSVEFALNMDDITPSAINFDKNPQLKGKSAGQVFDIVVESFARNGVLILPVFHKLTHHDPISVLWYREPDFPESRVIEAWLKIVKRYQHIPHVFAIDIKNEPHGAATWRTGNLATDWADAAERIGNAILKENPRLLIVVEGIDRETKREPSYGTFWGGVLDDVERNPVRLAIPNRVVYSPHVYGNDVFVQKEFKSLDFPANMKHVWWRQWAYIPTKGHGCLLIGELGGKCFPGSADEKWHNELASFIAANKRLSGAVVIWSFNPNSADTGGLVEADWTTPIKYKLDVYAKMCPSPSRIPPYASRQNLPSQK